MTCFNRPDGCTCTTGEDAATCAAPTPTRRRLPDRRPGVIETIAIGGRPYDADVGFDPATGAPREIFLSGAKAGTDMAAILADTSVVVSVALQHGIPASVLARSISRVPVLPDEPARMPASVIGAALDLLVRYESAEWEE